MKTPKIDSANEPNNEHKKNNDGGRPNKRGRKERGPLGFNSVMSDVKSYTTSSPTLGMPNFDPALAQAQQLDPGMQAAIHMGAIKSVSEELADATVRSHTAHSAIEQNNSILNQNMQPLVPSFLGKMSPSSLLNTVLDESRKLEISEAMKELHVELEPEDLGPLIVRIRKGPDGALSIGFRAQKGETARTFEQGAELLKNRLLDAGFTTSFVKVDHDPDLTLSR